jgi:hypothetical protein
VEVATGCLLTFGVTRAGSISFALALIWLAMAGVVALLLEWKNPSPGIEQLGVAGEPSKP